jgi:hypothetical protein
MEKSEDTKGHSKTLMSVKEFIMNQESMSVGVMKD